MLTPRAYLRHRKSQKAFKELEDSLLGRLRAEHRLEGNYGSRFNELSFSISNLIELLALMHVKDVKQSEMLRVFSLNPDLFHYASSKGLKTSSYLLYEAKSEEAKERIQGKIKGFLKEDIHQNDLFQHCFDQIEVGIAEILQIRYPDFFLEIDSLKEEIEEYRLAS